MTRRIPRHLHQISHLRWKRLPPKVFNAAVESVRAQSLRPPLRSIRQLNNLLPLLPPMISRRIRGVLITLLRHLISRTPIPRLRPRILVLTTTSLSVVSNSSLRRAAPHPQTTRLTLTLRPNGSLFLTFRIPPLTVVRLTSTHSLIRGRRILELTVPTLPRLHQHTTYHRNRTRLLHPTLIRPL
jgi:hypothetical protein